MKSNDPSRPNLLVCCQEKCGLLTFPKVYAELTFELHNDKYIPVVQLCYETEDGREVSENREKLIEQLKMELLCALKDSFNFYIRFSPNRVVEQVFSLPNNNLARLPVFKGKERRALLKGREGKRRRSKQGDGQLDAGEEYVEQSIN